MTVLVSRDSVAQSLLDVITSKYTGVALASRQLVPLDSVDSPQMPALFLVQRGEMQVRDAQGTAGVGLPAKRTMRVEVWIYTSDAQATDSIAASAINDAVDAVEDALQPDNIMTGTLTLAGVVHYVRIDGHIEYFLNVQGGPKSVAIVPVSILRP